MNSKQQILTVLAIVGLSIVSTNQVFAHTPTTLPYGALNHYEDESYFYHDNILYINVVPSQGNGFFMAENDFENDYSIDQAIDRFGIDEDLTQFYVQPSEFSETVLVYQLDNDLQFQLSKVIE